jgi:putative ABC transport system permease protein
MFGIYLWRELRRRARQSSIIAIGLALGIGLVLTVTALSTGVKNAQGDVLHSLYGLDTNITVTQAPASGTGGFGSFGFRGAFGTAQRPKAGTTVDVDTLRNVGQGTLTSANLATVAGLHNVAAAAGGLSLTDTKITLKIPSFSSSGGGGGFGQGGGGGGRFGGTLAPTITTVYGADLTSNAAALGPLSNGKLTAGRTFSSADTNADNALLDSSYAQANKLTVGSKITIAKTSFTVVGLVSIPSSDSPSDAYIPLERAQTLAGLKGEVNTIYVAASSASDITGVSKEISTALPKATVTNSDDLASQLTGSLSNASSLANNLGKWLAIAVLAAAFLLASLLTGSAVTRRVREFGTLKALGWTSRRVVGQVVGESIVIGIIGGAVGVGLGFLGAALVGHYSGTLTAAVGPTTGSATPGGARTFTGGGFPGSFGGGGTGSGFGGGTGGGFAGRFGRAATTASHSVPVHLSASVTGSAILAAVLLAIAGGLIAGMFGGWRAARLRPAMALARVE